MPVAAPASTFTASGFEAFLQSRREPEWSLDARRQAWQQFVASPWPDRRSEEWMRTDIRSFQLENFRLLSEAAGESNLPPAELALGVELGGSMTTLDGRLVSSRIDPALEKKGVLFGHLDDLLVEHGDRIRPHLMTRCFDPRFDRFASLHAACWSGGTLLYVPRGVSVTAPLHAFHVLSEGGSDRNHTLVVLEEGAQATLMSETASTSKTAAGMHCGGVELLVGPGANLRYVSLQEWGRGVWHFAQQKGMVDRDGSLQWTIGALGSRLSKVNQHVALVGDGAETQVNGVMFTEDKQHLSYHTLQHHVSGAARSDLLYKAALQDKSRTVWRGMIKVAPKADKTDGYQRNDTLMLSSAARADSIPGLEIEADDVRCTHGSTSGKVDEELIFYARSRGFTRQEAIQMIVTGFFQQVFDRISLESVREALARAIARRVREYD